MRIVPRTSSGSSCQESTGANWSSVYSPCSISTPIRVAERLLFIDQLSSSVSLSIPSR